MECAGSAPNRTAVAVPADVGFFGVRLSFFGRWTHPHVEEKTYRMKSDRP